MDDRVIRMGWRVIDGAGTRGADGEGAVGDSAIIQGEAFVWRHGRVEVKLMREENGWSVEHSSAGRLLGPRQTLYEGRHRRSTHAAWDVMARVVRVSRDEDEGIRVARSAAQWMRALGLPDEADAE